MPVLTYGTSILIKNGTLLTMDEQDTVLHGDC